MMVTPICSSPGEMASRLAPSHAERTSLQHAAGTLGNAASDFLNVCRITAWPKHSLDRATAWAQKHALVRLLGTYNLDREESAGILIEGRDRPPAVYCGHNPPYYSEFLEEYGFTKFDEDGLAYAIDLDLNNPEIQHLVKLAEQIRQRKQNIKIRGANLKDIDGEIDRIVDLQNRGLAHFPNFTPYTRASIEAMVLPMLDVVDPELTLFAEVDGQPAGWFPAVPNLNEIFIHLNGLRYPWDYLRLIKYSRYKPRSIAVKSVVVPPEYWDTGVGVLLFDEMARRAVAKGYTWADLSLTGEYNQDTWPLAHRMGAQNLQTLPFLREAGDELRVMQFHGFENRS